MIEVEEDLSKVKIEVKVRSQEVEEEISGGRRVEDDRSRRRRSQ